MAALRQSLDQQVISHKLHLLVLGYSCLDKTPLELIRESGSSIVSAVFVNGDAAAGQRALDEMQNYMPDVAPREDRDHVEVFDGGFGDFAQPANLRKLVSRIRSA